MEIAVAQHRRVEILFEPARGCPPDVEVAVAAGLQGQEKQDEYADQNQRRRFGGGKGNRQRHAEGDNSPVAPSSAIT